MIAFVRRRDFGNALPQQLSGLAVEAHQQELLFRLRTAGSEPEPASPPACSFPTGRSGARRNGCRDENPVAPDYGRRVAASRDVRFPFDVFGVAPMQRCAAASDAVPVRTPPLRP